MNAIFPIAPLFGMSTVVFFGLSTVLGLFFGFFLERAGFGSATNLTSVFILRDFRVFRVMFSAVITAMIGSQLLSAVGLLDLGLVEIDPTFFWSMLIGGLIFGVGFYVGGYCPGTAAVALARGRWDSAAFLFGIILGIYFFALLFDAVGEAEWFRNFYAPAGAHRQPLFGAGPSWPWVLGLTAVALAGFKLTPFIERRFALRTVEQLEAAKAGAPVPPNDPPRIGGILLKVGPALAGIGALAVLALEVGLPEPIPQAEAASEAPTVIEADAHPSPTVEPLTLASWIIAEAYRRAAEEPANSFVVDLRPESERARTAIPGALGLDLDASDDRGRLIEALTGLSEILIPANRNKPIVLVDADGADETVALVTALRRRGVNAMMLEGGVEAWRLQVLAPEAEWPTFQLRLPPVEPEPTPSSEVVEPPTEVATTPEETVEPQPEGAATPEEAPEPPAEVASSHEAPPPPEPVESAPLPEIDQAGLHERARRWLAGETDDLPPRIALPGTILLPAKAATVRARGGAGGGCG
jgi:hypothetical protein